MNKSTDRPRRRTLWLIILALVFSAHEKAEATYAGKSTDETSTVIFAEDLGEDEKKILEEFGTSLESYRKQLKIPGMSAAIIKKGELIWARGFGYADIENKVPATPCTTYHLASLTKTFASQIIMKLVEDGKIDLEAPVKKYGVNIRGDQGIKVKHLLTHTAEGTPGRRYKYNGHLYGFLGKVIKKASGKSFRQLVTAEILKPAEMNDTAPVLPRSVVKKFKANKEASSIKENFKRINKNLAQPYSLNDSLEPVAGKYPGHFGVSTGLISNVVDMAKYDRAIDNNAFVSRRGQRQIFTAAVSNSRRTLPYGLGWFVQTFADTKLIWHYGWEVNFSALILKVPAEDVTFVIFANTDYLSRPFELGAGDVLNSSFAVEFLKTIAFKDRFAHPAVDIDRQAKTGNIVTKLTGVKDAGLKALLKRELISNIMLNHHMKRAENTGKLMDVYIRAFTRDEFADFADLPVIATIDNVGDNQYEIIDFELKEDKSVRVYAVGEGSEGIMCDYGGIENAQTGELVWEMHYIFAEHAGGAAKNLKHDRIVPLRSGEYRLHYRTDESHSFGKWNSLPPDHYWWGIRVFDADGQHPAPPFWQTATPEELGWSSKKLNALKSDLERLKTSALMIVTDGKVVFEWGKTTNNIASHSTRKSLLSALYGIYAAEDKIDTSLTLEELGIEENISLTKEEKQARVIDLLKARSGVYIPAAAEAKSMRDARPKRGSHPPGTHWYYNNWDFNVLGTIFREQTGEDIYEAFNRRIAEPIGMQDYIPERQRYSYEENFSLHPAYPFLISARDFARFGQLFLQRGRWEDEQIIPARWIAESTRSYSEAGRRSRGYGYMWWTVEDDYCGMKKGDYYASGYGGQKIFVLPRMNTVVVHRVNIYVPGIDVSSTSIAPFQVMAKIMKAHTGERQKGRPIAASGTVPRKHLLPDYVHIARIASTEHKERIIARRRNATLTWLILTAVCLAVVIYDLARGSKASPPAWLLSVLVVALFGPLGLFAYYASYRFARTVKLPPPASWRIALAATFCTMSVYTIAIVVTISFFVFRNLEPSIATILISAYLAPFCLSLLIVRAPLASSRLGTRYLTAVRRTMSAEIISVNVMLAGSLPAYAFLKSRWFPNNLEMAEPVFWLMLMLIVLAGALLIYPFNLWFCYRRFGTALVHCQTKAPALFEDTVRSPNLKNSWHVLALSLLVMFVLITLTIINLP